MLFAVGDPQADDNFVFEPYNVNNSISVAANLREAFKKSELLQSGYKRALVAIDAPTMLVPLDEYREQDAETHLEMATKRRHTDEHNAQTKCRCSVCSKQRPEDGGRQPF